MASGNNINGQSGPYTGYKNVGAYGRNAAINFQKLLETSPEQAAKTDISYSEKKSLFDAFGYATEDIRHMDGNKDGVLDRGEIVQGFGAAQIGVQYLKTVDRNRDKKVDVNEMAAFVLFQDDAPFQLAEAVKAYEDNGLAKNPELRKAKNILAGGLGAKPSADGLITAKEADVAHLAVLRAGNLTGTILDEFHNTLDLKKVGQMFKQESAKNLPPGGVPLPAKDSTPYGGTPAPTPVPAPATDSTPPYTPPSGTPAPSATDNSPYAPPVSAPANDNNSYMNPGFGNSQQQIQSFMQIFTQLLQMMLQMYTFSGAGRGRIGV